MRDAPTIKEANYRLEGMIEGYQNQFAETCRCLGDAIV